MAEDKKNENEIAVIEVTEEYLKDRLYMIRGKRVLLDADLAIIYGYTTKAFNQQVKNNIEKFDEDFMFELSDKEVENLRSKFLTANFAFLLVPQNVTTKDFFKNFFRKITCKLHSQLEVENFDLKSLRCK